MNRKREGDKRAEGREGERVQSVNVKQEADGAAAGARGGRHVTEAMDLDQATHCITSSYYPRCPGDTAEAEATLDAGRDVKSIRAVVRNQSAVAVGVVGYLSIAPPLQHIRGREGGLLNNAVILRLPFRASLSLLLLSFPHSFKPTTLPTHSFGFSVRHVPVLSSVSSPLSWHNDLEPNRA